ncbi:alanine racemase [Propionibacterium sp. oral taxon 192 str. F0372]|uniref:alanine racemase n=1 Tax=Propionibacterium sp. oral taxon 192 TaxID=671222 RepID=UPI000352ACEC|nr:alanine racemase [Propionibacterium sp. oral taxon 192]EPH02359.1 alanine racemase [Propionibacterium sp. oral taxon 192 str. F0372]
MIDISGLRPVWAEIDLDAVAHNIREIRQLVGPSVEVTGVVKANAYGHGSPQFARCLLANGATRLAVATLDEALELRDAGIDARILILGWTRPQQAATVVASGIDQCVYSMDLARALSQAAVDQGREAMVHIKIDSGMGRIGLRPDENPVDEIVAMLQLPGISFEGIFTHFAVADTLDKTYTRGQFEAFTALIDEIAAHGHVPRIRHCANSATIIDLPEMHLDMVRPGIILYGVLPSDEVMAERIDLHPTMRLKAMVSHVKQLAAGETVSYGRKFTAERPSVIASLPLGYADGYHRILSGRAEVVIRGRRAPVVGRVCMDQFMIDVTDVPGVSVGDEVLLWGTDDLRCEEVADWAETIGYELLTSVARRVPRVFLEGGKVVEVVNLLLE